MYEAELERHLDEPDPPDLCSLCGRPYAGCDCPRFYEDEEDPAEELDPDGALC